ncbi:MAG: TonB family protein, partial [Pyrinomonadaceae bacterium]
EQQPAPQRKTECDVTIMRGNELDRKVKIIAKPDPKWSDEELRRQGSGIIILSAVFCGSGKVTDIRVRRGMSEELDRKAVDAARKIRYIPAEKDGQKVSQWLQLEYRLNISR